MSKLIQYENLGPSLNRIVKKLNDLGLADSVISIGYGQSKEIVYFVLRVNEEQIKDIPDWILSQNR